MNRPQEEATGSFFPRELAHSVASLVSKANLGRAAKIHTFVIESH